MVLGAVEVGVGGNDYIHRKLHFEVKDNPSSFLHTLTYLYVKMGACICLLG